MSHAVEYLFAATVTIADPRASRAGARAEGLIG